MVVRCTSKTSGWSNSRGSRLPEPRRSSTFSRDGGVVQLHRPGGGARHVLGGAGVAEQPSTAPAIGVAPAISSALVGVGPEEAHAVGDELGRGLVPARDEEDAHADDLGVGEGRPSNSTCTSKLSRSSVGWSRAAATVAESITSFPAPRWHPVGCRRRPPRRCRNWSVHTRTSSCCSGGMPSMLAIGAGRSAEKSRTTSNAPRPSSPSSSVSTRICGSRARRCGVA